MAKRAKARTTRTATTRAAPKEQAVPLAPDATDHLGPGVQPGQTEQLPVPGTIEPSWQTGQAKPDPNGTIDQRMAAMVNEQNQMRKEPLSYPLKK
jgi:hypothetical protein